MNRIVLRIGGGVLLAAALLLASYWLSDSPTATPAAALPPAWQSMHQAQLRIDTPASTEPQWLTVRVADEAHERAQGMQHLPARVIRDQPIWFVFDRPRATGWHMRNVALALDIVYVDATGTVIAIEQMQPQGSGYGITTPIAAALELAAGQAKRLGILPKAKLTIAPGPEATP